MTTLVFMDVLTFGCISPCWKTTAALQTLLNQQRIKFGYKISGAPTQGQHMYMMQYSQQKCLRQNSRKCWSLQGLKNSQTLCSTGGIYKIYITGTEFIIFGMILSDFLSIVLINIASQSHKPQNVYT